MFAVDIFVGALVLVAVLMIVVTTFALWRANDALTRVNVMGPTTGISLPLLLIAKLFYDTLGSGTGGATINDVVRAVIAILGLLIIASISGFYLGRTLQGLAEEQRAEEKLGE